MIAFNPTQRHLALVEEGNTLTQERLCVLFFRGPVKGPKAWRGRNRMQAEWIYDIFRAGEEVIAVCCYKCMQYGCESRLLDGWRANDAEQIQARRTELANLMKSDYVRVQRAEGRSACTWNDLGL